MLFLRRYPRKSYHAWLQWLIRRLGRSEFTHVAIGQCSSWYDGVVFDVTIKGHALWPLLGYVQLRPVTDIYEFDTDRMIDFDRYMPGERKRALPTFLRWLTRGRWPARDCVTLTAECLRHAGVDVPVRMTTLRQLHDWITDQGWKHGAVSDRAPAAQRRSDSAAR